MPVWLDKSTELPVTELTTDALLDEWANHRNDLRGYMAAEEVMKRLTAERELHRQLLDKPNGQ